MLPIRTILHPTDFSEPSRAAFRLACAVARDSHARLILLHVIAPPTAVFGEGLLPPPEDDSHERLTESLRQLQAAEPTLTVEARLVDGGEVAGILAEAEHSHCDLIVMGTHGRTGLGRLLMGSVAEEIVRKAPCPVLTLKYPRREVKVAEPALAAGAAS